MPEQGIFVPCSTHVYLTPDSPNMPVSTGKLQPDFQAQFTLFLDFFVPV
jgi:hypothetical protein